MLSSLCAAGMQLEARNSRRGTYYFGLLCSSPTLQAAIDGNELDDFFSSFTALYREIYGHHPWNEYLICTQLRCRHVIGILDAYPDCPNRPLRELEQGISAESPGHHCSRCGELLTSFYPPEPFFERARSSFRQNVVASLLFDSEEELQGFALGWKTTIGQGWQDKLLLGLGDEFCLPELTYDAYIEEVKIHLGSHIRTDTIAFNSAEWAVSPKARGNGVSVPLYAQNLEAAQQSLRPNDLALPVIGHSLLGSKALMLFQRFGFTHGDSIEGSRQVRVYSTLPCLRTGIAELLPNSKTMTR